MTDPIWVPLAAILAIHDRQIARHRGASGMRDLNLLESACARPLNQAVNGTPSLPPLAAAYAYGITKAHAFVDGNKRTAFVTALTFLRLNGMGFRPDPVQGVRMMEGLASNNVTEAAFSAWLQDGMEEL